jgi:hypothetical protein
MLEVVSKSTFYSIVASIIAFASFMIYFYKEKPSYVYQIDSTGTLSFSPRMCVVYSLLYASAIGLVVVAISGGFLYFTTGSSNRLISGDVPSKRV